MRWIVIATFLSLCTGTALGQTVPAPVTKSDADAATRAARRIEDAKAIADCQRNWEPATHMTRKEWLQTCKRVQERFRQLEIR